MDVPVRGMAAAAAAVGMGVGLLAYIVHQVQAHRERREMSLHITELQDEVHQLRQQILNLRTHTTETVDAAKRAVEGRIRRRRGRLASGRSDISGSGYDTDGTSTMYSACDTDDDMFYDLSSNDEADMEEGRGTSQTETSYADIDQLLDGSLEEKSRGLELVQQRLQASPEDPQLLWRAARAYKYQVDRAAAKDDSDQQLHYIEQGKRLVAMVAKVGKKDASLSLEPARRAVELAPSLGEAQMWFAILLGLRSDYLPLTEKLNNGNLFHKHLYLAIERLPENRILFHMMAKFKYAIANLSWIERRAAKMLGEVPDFNMSDVIVDGLKAEELSKEPWPENKLTLAQAYLANGDYAKGLLFLDQAKLASQQAQNIVTLKEAEELLKKYQKHRK